MAKEIEGNFLLVEASTLVRASREEELPLSFAQQRLWFLDQLAPNNPLYNCPGAVKLDGRLDLEVLEGVINEIVRRHEVLRTRIEVKAGEPVQVIDEWGHQKLEIEDLTNLPREEREEGVRRRMREEARTGFDLSRGPLLRVKVLKLKEEEHVVLFTMHHIVSDAWSIRVLVREVCVLYEAMKEGKGSPLPELEIQYADYAKWQREYLAGEVLEGEARYWKEQLKDAAVLDLPTDHARPAVPSYRGARERVEIGKELSAGLRRLGQREGATLFMVLMAAFKVLLMRYSGEEDVSIGTVIANRTRREVEGLIGFFVNTLVMRTDLGGNPSFRGLIKRERKVALGAYTHQEVPFERLVQEMNPERGLSRSPLFQVLMVLQNAWIEELEISGLKVCGIKNEAGVAKFDLMLELTEGGEGIAGCLEYSQDLLEGDTVGRMARHYERVVGEVVRDAEQGIRDIELMSEGEKRQLIEEWNETERAYEETRLVHEMIARQARRRPEGLAVKCEQEQISYRELDERSNQLAHYLQDLGVGPEVLVGVCLERSIEMVVGLLGILKAGGAYVPMDPTYPKQRLSMMVEDGQIRLLLTQEHLAERFEEISTNLICLDQDRSTISTRNSADLPAQVEPDNAAYMIYTSGSTGRPKGVIVTHRSVLNLFNAVGEKLHLSEDDVWTMFHSSSFDFSVWEMWGALICGGTLVVVPYFVARTPEEFCDLVHQQGVTILSQTPSVFRHFIKADEVGGVRRGLSLRAVIFGGEALEFQSLRGWIERHGDELPQLINMYGITETTVHTTSKRVMNEDLREATGSVVGKPLANMRMYVLEERMQAVPVGVIGELYVGGEGVARGYMGREELTAERFPPAPYGNKPGERVYKTGDLVRYVRDGNIEYVGRKDDQVKIRGYRIELGEIEAVLNEHRSVKQSVVMVREDERGTKRLYGYVTGEAEISTTALRSYLRERLPDYMVPAAIMILEAMPITANGKIDRKRLLEMPWLEEADRRFEQEQVGARTRTEKILVEIFRQVLKLDRVGIHDNFFELGGDSILSIQIIAKANEAGLGLTPKQLFEHQSIAELAAVACNGDTIELEQGDVVGEAPLTPIQSWFFEEHFEEPEHFNQAVMLEAKEELEVETLREVMRRLVKHHDVLRHTFHRTESSWAQICNESDERPVLEEVDISQIDESLERGAIEEAAERYQKGMNLGEGPLIRVVVFGGKGRRQRMLIIAHHLVMDGVSWRILLGEIERGYEQARRGEEIKLSVKTTSYKRWAERLKEEAQSERLRTEANYWLAQAGESARGVPVDKVGVNTMASSRNVTATLNEEQTTALLQDVARVYKAQINEVLLCAAAIAISEWSNEQTVSVEMEGHGREEIVNDVDLTRTIGWFTVLYPIKLEVRGRNNIELLRNLKEQIRESARRGIYFGMLKYLSEDSDLRERLRALPQAVISFNYLGQLDLVLKEESLFRGAIERTGETQSRKEKRRYLIEINGSVIGGRLNLIWTYSENIHRRETIEAVAERTMEVLREVVAGSRSTTERPYALSDFPLATIDQRKLDQLMSTGNDIEDIYALSPLQKAMLFHNVFGSNPQTLFVQLTCFLRGKVDLSAFKKAWQRLVRRHTILRTAFLWEELDDPVQVVHRQVVIPVEYMDWRQITREEQERRFEVLVESDRWRGFDLADPPLMRLSLIRLGDELYRFIWSHHHLLLDGWSSPLLLQEFFLLYRAYRQGEEPVMEESAPYREYIAWLKRQDSHKAEMYWREKLKGFSRPTRLWIDRGIVGSADEGEVYKDQQVNLSSEATARLESFVRQHHLTINTVLQGAWALVLSKYSGEEDIVFGTTVSGRPVDLPGSESIIGPFINTLPVRMKIPFRSSILSWLSEIQSDQIEYGQYAYGSLVEQYSEVPLGIPLYESILIFENYPKGDGTGKREVEISDVRSPVRTKYPLTIISGPSSELLLSVAYDQRRFDDSDISRLLGHLQKIIEVIGQNSEEVVWPVSPLSEGEQEQLLAGWIERKALERVKEEEREGERGRREKGSPYEEMLCGIWAELFGVDELSREENFFEKGGHSLLATQMMSRVREVFQVEIPLRAVFEEPTIEGLTRRIEEAVRSGENQLAPPLVRASREGRVPLSFAQQRLWFIDQLAPGNAVYNITGAVRLEGRLDLMVLERAINEIVRRHEVLRTRFEVEAGEPVQVIDEWEPRRLEVEDLTGLAREEREAEVNRIAREEAGTGFDLSRGPLLRVKVLQLGEEEHVVLYTMHHIVSDGWSMGILIREVGTLYQAYRAGEESPLEELPIQYADFAVWQREWLKGELLEEQLSYWKQQLGGSLPVLELPSDRPRPAVPSFRGARDNLLVSSQLSEGLKELSRHEGVTLYMTLLAAFQTLLYRYTGQTDILVGSPIVGRTKVETERVIGYFANTLVLRSHLSARYSFQELLRQVRGVALGAYAHQEMPFEQIVEALQPARNLSHNPLFQVLLGFHNLPQLELAITGLSLSQVETENMTARFDLALDLGMGTERLSGTLEYNADMFESETIRRMIGHYGALLESIVSAPDRGIWEQKLITEVEEEQLLKGWKHRKEEYRQEQCIHQRFEEYQNSEAVAVVYEEARISYRELNQRANQLGHYLRKLGVGPEEKVGICVERSIELLVSILGVLKAGGAYVALDPGVPSERLRLMVEETGLGVVITREGEERRVRECGVRRVCVDREWELIGQERRDNPESGARWENLAYVIYTSGSTGRPKGVEVSHRGVINLVESMRSEVGYGARDIWTVVHSYGFDFSVWEIWGALLEGGCLVVVGNEERETPEEFNEMLEREGVTILNQTPSAMRQLMSSKEVQEKWREAKGGRVVICGGEEFPRELAGRLLEGGRAVWNFYGPTEGTVWTTAQRVKSEEEGVLIGGPISNVEVYVLDRDEDVVPVGVRGELHIGGVGLSRGYCKQGEETARKFIPHPWSERPGERLYKTGDRVRYVGEGNIEYQGRVDDQVKVRGYRIELGEIEAVLRGHAEVKEAVVVVREEEVWEKQLMAYLVSTSEPRPTVTQLHTYLREHLPEYMVPSKFILLDELPLTPNGKIDRRALPAAGPMRPELEKSYQKPRSPVEEVLADIWAEVLKLERVGIYDNFFELGGHSLLAAQVISRVREAFQVEISLHSLFESPTVCELGERIEQEVGTGAGLQAPPIERVSREGRLPLSFAQQRLWFLDQLVPNHSFYNIPGAVRLEGRLDLMVLERAINEIVRRHEVLRTRFEAEAGEPVQVIDEWEPGRLEVNDLTILTREEKQEEVSRIAREEAVAGFDLSRGPLLRVKVLQLGEEEHVLLYTMHHIVSDRWSMGILSREIGALYQAYSAGEESPLEELPIQYADFAVWQREWLQGEVLEEQLSYWRQQLGGSLPVLELPSDRPRPARQTHRGAQHSCRLSTTLSDSLKELSLERNCTLFMTLLAAFKTLLYYLTGQTDIAVGTDIANRNRAETENLIGFFVNQLVLRAELLRNSTFVELLREVRAITLGAYAHQDLPFEKLVEALNPDRDESRTPLFQVKLVLQNALVEELSLPGLTLSPVTGMTGTAKFDLLLNLNNTEGGLDASLEYNTDLFEESTAIRILNRFHTLLDRIVERPDVRLRELVESLIEEDKREDIEKEMELEGVRLKKLTSIRRRTVGGTRTNER
jgi:amino acid adenylation domain-containing protein/non-ribosomal peptide synthase protein (TIGR01720 family)